MTWLDALGARRPVAQLDLRAGAEQRHHLAGEVLADQRPRAVGLGEARLGGHGQLGVIATQDPQAQRRRRRRVAKPGPLVTVGG